MFATLRANHPSIVSVARRSFSKSIPPTAVVSQHNYEYSLYSKTLPVVDFFAQAKSKPSYKLNHGAAGFAKRRPITKTNHSRMVSVVSQVGEDAYFRREDAIGVADGIGGWANIEGADSALYSTQLMHHVNAEMDRYENIDDPYFFQHGDANPVEILQQSYGHSLEVAKKNNILGATTACIAVLRSDDLRVANIGDCGISVIRNNHYVFRSEEQQHAFNFPYQLGIRSRDQPHHAQSFTVKVQKGDIVIMGSDGLYDNLFDREILSLVREHVSAYTIPGNNQRPARVGNLQPQILADILANAAKEVSETTKQVDTPFQRRALAEGHFFEGGKKDDISVVVAIINDCEDSPDRRL